MHLTTDEAEVEEERREMFEAIGKAINEWSRVESALAHLASVCLGPSSGRQDGSGQYFDSHVVSAGVYAIDNFSAKLKFVEAILTARLKDTPGAPLEILDCWQRAKKKAQTFSSRRNHLAHWGVITFYPIEKRDRRVKLSPPVGSLSWPDAAANRSGYTLHEVNQFERAFIGVAHRIGIVTVALSMLPQLKVAFAKQIGRTIHAERENSELVKAIRAAIEFDAV